MESPLSHDRDKQPSTAPFTVAEQHADHSGSPLASGIDTIEQSFPPEPVGMAGEILPRILGDFEILERIGQGGMGVVYRARQISLNRIVALKLIRRDRFEGLPAHAQAEMLARFNREAEAVARLEHDHVVPVYAEGAEGQFTEGPVLAPVMD